VHSLLADERDAIIAPFDAWSETDRSHRKLAHRGSYERLVWVSPATGCVFAANGLVLISIAERREDGCAGPARRHRRERP
jgi:hypothetical protein